MLRYRLLTAGLLIPLVILAIFTLSPSHFAMVVGIVAALVSFEWLGLFKINIVGRLIIVILQLLLFYPLYQYMPLAFITVGLLLWLVIFGKLAGWLLSTTRQALTANRRFIFAGLWQIQACFIALAQIHAKPHGALWLTALLLLVWAVDSGAYFAGRAFGQRKLAPSISPNKTWEGVLGAVLLAAVWLGLNRLVWQMLSQQWFALLVVTVMIVIVSILGDLVESWVKRSLGVKDSGHILPGHGGLLDRLDSLLSSSVFFYFGLNYILQFGSIHCTLTS